MLISQGILNVEKNGKEKERHRELSSSSSLSDDHQFDWRDALSVPERKKEKKEKKKNNSANIPGLRLVLWKS